MLPTMYRVARQQSWSFFTLSYDGHFYWLIGGLKMVHLSYFAPIKVRYIKCSELSEVPSVHVVCHVRVHVCMFCRTRIVCGD